MNWNEFSKYMKKYTQNIDANKIVYKDYTFTAKGTVYCSNPNNRYFEEHKNFDSFVTLMERLTNG